MAEVIGTILQIEQFDSKLHKWESWRQRFDMYLRLQQDLTLRKTKQINCVYHSRRRFSMCYIVYVNRHRSRTRHAMIYRRGECLTCTMGKRNCQSPNSIDSISHASNLEKPPSIFTERIRELAASCTWPVTLEMGMATAFVINLLRERQRHKLLSKKWHHNTQRCPRNRQARRSCRRRSVRHRNLGSSANVGRPLDQRAESSTVKSTTANSRTTIAQQQWSTTTSVEQRCFRPQMPQLRSATPQMACPAYGKQCNNCNKLGHFALCCRSAKARLQAIDRCYDDNNSHNVLPINAVSGPQWPEIVRRVHHQWSSQTNDTRQRG